MSQEVISVTGNEILFDALSAKVTLINKNAFLTVEFQVYSEHPHNLPYSPSDDLQKRIIDLVNTGNGISSINGVKVLTELVNDKTKFTVEVPIAVE